MPFGGRLHKHYVSFQVRAARYCSVGRKFEAPEVTDSIHFVSIVKYLPSCQLFMPDSISYLRLQLYASLLLSYLVRMRLQNIPKSI